MPLRYTIREQLETIGDPSSTAYPFAALYGYHANGTVAEAQFYSAGSPETNKRYRYLFDPSSYDALNRLTSANYQGWDGNWVATLAHDLAGITYDPAGNITTLQRYRENATLIDHLTYSYPGTSNRLSSVTDAVGVTAEPWDAEAGAFTYDANGNLTTAPAPYAVTAVSYDQQSLPLTLTSTGTTTTYRYDHAGQRIAKQVGAGNTELYLLEGAATLGVVTVNGAGSAVSWHVTLLAGDKVVGRQPNVGNRKYYHTDLLGSTRAVVEGTTVVESYDFDPWGMLMPGRTLAGPTKEGFTSKERDAESGLDYFGARYYMAALARWTAVDPLSDEFPEWSSYAYAFNSPVILIDPTGLAPESAAADRAQCPPLCGHLGVVAQSSSNDRAILSGEAQEGQQGRAPEPIKILGVALPGVYPAPDRETDGLRIEGGFDVGPLRNLGGSLEGVRGPDGELVPVATGAPDLLVPGGGAARGLKAVTNSRAGQFLFGRGGVLNSNRFVR